METLIVHPENQEKLDALKSFLKSSEIDFDVEMPYPLPILDGVKKSLEEAQNGRLTTFTKAKDLL